MDNVKAGCQWPVQNSGDIGKSDWFLKFWSHYRRLPKSLSFPETFSWRRIFLNTTLSHTFLKWRKGVCWLSSYSTLLSFFHHYFNCFKRDSSHGYSVANVKFIQLYSNLNQWIGWNIYGEARAVKKFHSLWDLKWLITYKDLKYWFYKVKCSQN